MKSISYVDKKYDGELAASWIDGIAKRILVGIFSRMQRGHLTIVDSGEVMVFGAPLSQGEITAHVVVLHPSFYRYVLFGGTTGSGEAYMVNAWQSPDLTQVIRVMVQNLDVIKRMDSGIHRLYGWLGTLLHKFNENSKDGARRNIAAHYDLSNDFFSLFLDPLMMYSSAVYPTATATLDQAAAHKLQRVCERLQLQPSDHLLEIGTGWGGLAVYAAQKFGCRVTSITISEAQYTAACARVKDAGLESQISIRLCDYRDMQGQFDKLVSIEMIEAVGYQYYPAYFAKCSQLLKPQGFMLIQAITIPHERFEAGRNSMDFIRRYIFPGGCLPSQLEIVRNLSMHTDMELIDFVDITADYARTLAAWKTRFFSNLNQVKELGFDEVFVRMWDFYLSYCEGGFTERVIGTAQFVFAKPHARLSAAVTAPV